MKCRFWTTIFKLLLPFAASALTIDADINIRTEINDAQATSTVCKVKLDAVPDGVAWTIKNISGTWNGQTVASNQPFRFTVNKATASPTDEVLNYLLPFATEKIIPPKSDGTHKLDDILINNLLKPYGFAVDKMKINGEWQIKTQRAILSIIGSGENQQIKYRMLLDDAKREIEFDFKIKTGIQNGAPFADDTTIKRVGVGIVKIAK